MTDPSIYEKTYSGFAADTSSIMMCVTSFSTEKFVFRMEFYHGLDVMPV